MGSGPARRRGISRLLAVCALFGLFLMHGAPTSAAESCHGGMTALAPMPAEHDHLAMTMAGAHRPGLSFQPDPLGKSGASCVSTRSNALGFLPEPGLLAVLAVAALAAWATAWLRPGAGSGRRAPPSGGRDHLLRACIART